MPDARLGIFRSVLGILPPGHLVDLACGHGKFSVVAHGMGWHVTAVDARTERMRDYVGIDWIQSDIREYTLPGDATAVSVLGLL